MPSFTVGEEVHYLGQRWIIAGENGDRPYRYRLLATSADGVQVAWANPVQLTKISAYRTPRDDTDRVA